MTVRITVYNPREEYVCTGFWRVEVVPSPKSHAQLLIGTDDLEISVNVTRRGAVPPEGVDRKSVV